MEREEIAQRGIHKRFRRWATRRPEHGMVKMGTFSFDLLEEEQLLQAEDDFGSEGGN